MPIPDPNDALFEAREELEHLRAEATERREETERLRAENVRFREELAETNRGVTALYLELDRRAEELEQKDRQKDQFLAMLGHELRNPIAAAQTALDLLRSHRPSEDAKAKRAEEIAARQLHNLRRIVDDLLDVSRVAQGRVRIRTEGADLAALVREAAECHREQISTAGHTLRTSITDEPLWGWFDRTRIEQVVVNLLDNAVKYTSPPGQIDVRVRRVRVDETPWARLDVEDTGAGIDPHRLPDVFESFVQEERNIDRSHGGLGLGLSLVRNLVELHGGEIEAHSAGRDRGSTFSIWLPLSGERGSSPWPSSSSSRRSATRRP